MIYEKALDIGITIVAIECMPDHVHIFCKCKPDLSISLILKYLKGYSSYKLRLKFHNLKKYKALWAPSYYCETIGHLNEKTIIKYINDQKKLI